MSGSEQTAEFIYILALIIFVASALVVRKIPIGKGLQMFAGWVIIFLAAFVAFSLKDNVVDFAQQVMDEHKAETTGIQTGDELRIKQSLDGHFWVDAEVNGERVRFLIDSGATTTSLSESTARRSRVEPRGGMPAVVRTANGIVTVQRGRAEQVVIGPIRREDVAVHISEAFGDMNVLGMNFLSSLSSWSVQGRWLVMKA